VSGTVVVTAATSPLGRRVCTLAAADPGVERVVAIDRPALAPALHELAGAGRGAPIEACAVELSDPELKQRCVGASVVIHLGETAPLERTADALDGTGSAMHLVQGSAHLFDAAAASGVDQLVVLSSAMVYGAWPNNPIPLTEDAPLRPAPELPFAVAKAEIERRAGEWRDDRSGSVAVAILRPAIAVGPESVGWLGRSPWNATGVQVDDVVEPPSQFVHLDDLAAAVDHARRHRLDGPFNVAPDGWIPAEALRDLSGPAPRVLLPAAVAERIASARWRLGLTGTPPAVLPYTMYSWVVANDRLRATGWQPTHTNEMAFVDADRVGPLTGLDPRRRQLLSLAAAGGLLGTVVLAIGVAIRRLRRRATSG
jgi:nucleoside-diphosphate-sugar epimerase